MLPKNEEQKPQDENPERELGRLNKNPLRDFMRELTENKHDPQANAGG